MKWVKSIVNTATASIKDLIKPHSLLNGAIEVCMLSDVGCHRAQNEDHVLYVKPGDKTDESKKVFLQLLLTAWGGIKADRSPVGWLLN